MDEIRIIGPNRQISLSGVQEIRIRLLSRMGLLLQENLLER